MFTPVPSRKRKKMLLLFLSTHFTISPGPNKACSLQFTPGQLSLVMYCHLRMFEKKCLHSHLLPIFCRMYVLCRLAFKKVCGHSAFLSRRTRNTARFIAHSAVLEQSLFPVQMFRSVFMYPKLVTGLNGLSTRKVPTSGFFLPSRVLFLSKVARRESCQVGCEGRERGKRREEKRAQLANKSKTEKSQEKKENGKGHKGRKKVTSSPRKGQAKSSSVLAAEKRSAPRKLG